MTEEYASLISHWNYKAPYSMYSMDGSNDCISELMSGDYFYVLDNLNTLVGFFCNGNSARVPGGYEIGIYKNGCYLDIGLGLRPDLTGKGRGLEFLSVCINFLKERFKAHNFQLVVAIFNERAIKVYERAGFIKGIIFKSEVEDQDVEFIVMNYSLENNQNNLA
jgi:ribosomal-protein-alanine N-acetyltransferase